MTSELIYKFQEYLTEAAKATEKKPTKEVDEINSKVYDYQDPKLFNNINPDQLLNGVAIEIRKDNSMPLEKAMEIVVKQLGKDPMYYIENAAFGVEGIGYTDEVVGLTPEEIKGKYKSSGYGDLKEAIMNNSEKLKELLEEAVAGVPSLGNPFADRKPEAYETKFEAYLAENARTDAEEEGYLDGMKDEKADLKKEAKKEVKKEGRMKYNEVLKEANRLGEMAKKKIESKIYERAIEERKAACSLTEDESIAEFVNQEAVKDIQKEIALLEKKLMEATADKNNMG
ncbi:MAG: hypothetical protein GY870_10190 [archaeon]|nr:hypothetical protein [archaeon]